MQSVGFVGIIEDMFQDDIDFLVQETFLEAHRLKDAPLVADRISFYPQSPGVIYQVKKNHSAFTISGKATKNISQAIGEKESFCFFMTDNELQAEVIVDQMFNRHFPLFEEHICNLGDPGFSWWLVAKPKSFELCFRNVFFKEGHTVIKLGPLGDPSFALEWFRRFAEKLKITMNLKPINFQQKKIILTQEETDNSFENIFILFQEIFTKGTHPNNFLSRVPMEFDAGFILFLGEISFLRAFWINLEKQFNQVS